VTQCLWFQDKYPHFSFINVYLGTHFSHTPLQILNSNNFQQISIRAYPRFIINALCPLVMAPFFTLTPSSSREEGATQDSRSHLFKEDFFLNLPLDGFEPRQQQGLSSFVTDSWTYLCWIITQERIFLIVVGINIIWKHPKGYLWKRNTLLCLACFVMLITISIV